MPTARRQLIVFPTRVGMNRNLWTNGIGLMGVPHARGDEPVRENVRVNLVLVFPTRVGMNRIPA